MKIHEIIEKTARSVVNEMKKAGIVKENKMGSYKKTEKILYCYYEWKSNPELYLNGPEREETKRFAEMIEKSFEASGIVNDYYFDIIPMKYRDRMTHEAMAEHYNVDVSMISKRRTKLISQLSPLIYSDDFINELFEM